MPAKKAQPKQVKPVSKKLLTRFLRDFELYSGGCLKIRTKQAKIVPFVCNTPQQIVNRIWARQYKTDKRIRMIVLKARQEGISTLVAGRFFRRMHLIPNQDALVVADETDRGKKIFSIYDRYYGYLPDEVKPMKRYSSKMTQLVLDNPDDDDRASNPGLGCTITVETANDANAGRGGTTQMLHASEMAFWERPEPTWNSLMQAVPDYGSEVVIESTANGVGNFFHQMWEAAVAGQSSFVPVFLPWWIMPEYQIELSPEKRSEILDTLDDQELEWLTEGIYFPGFPYLFGDPDDETVPEEPVRLTLEQLAWRRMTIMDKLGNDERMFKQEYPATPTEAFLTSGNCFFDEDKLADYQDFVRQPISRGNLVELPSGGIAVSKSTKGHLRIWLRPGEKLLAQDREPHYVIAADTAMGKLSGTREQADLFSEKGGRDFSCAYVYDLANSRFVAVLHGRMAPEVFARQLWYLGYLYSTLQRDGTRRPATIGVERNHSSGETVIRLLSKGINTRTGVKRYPRVYISKTINRRTGERRKETYGWTTNAETRQVMLDELAQAIREDGIWIPDPDLIKECFTFVLDENGKAQAEEGCHDDRVIAASICLQIARHEDLNRPVGRPPKLTVSSDPTGWF